MIVRCSSAFSMRVWLWCLYLIVEFNFLLPLCMLKLDILITSIDCEFSFSSQFCNLELGILNSSLHCGIWYSYRFVLCISFNMSLSKILLYVLIISKNHAILCYFVCLLIVRSLILQFITCLRYWWKTFPYCIICLSASLIPQFLLIARSAIDWILTFDCFMHAFDYLSRLTFACL